MSQRFHGRHGHVRRRSNLPAADPSSASPAEPRLEAAAAPTPEKAAPPEPVAAPPKPVFEEFQGGPRRSVFDLLKEKYPDLGGGRPPAKPLIAPAQEKAAQEKLAQEKAAQEKLAQEKAAQEKLAREKAAQEKLAQEKAAQEKLAREKAAQEKLAQERAAQERAALEKAAQERAAQDKAALEKAALEKAALEKAALEKATQEKEALERAAQEKAAQEKLAREKAAQERVAEEKAAQEKLAREKAALEKSWSSALPGSRQILRPNGQLADQETLAREEADQESLAAAPTTSAAVPEAALASVPIAEKPRTPPARAAGRSALPAKKVLAFWAGVALLLVAGIFLLSRWKPAPQNAASTAAVPTPSLPPAGSLSLEPEKVVVTLPADPGGNPAPKLPAATPPPPKETRPATTPASPNPRDKNAEKKPTPPKPEPSRMVIEPVAPIVPPVRIGGSQPEYPVEARAAGLEGTVVLYGLIGRDGKVREARVVRGLSPPLDAAALAAFRTWRFSPATQKGKKVDFKYNAGIEFRINSPAAQVAAATEPAPPAPAPPAPSAPLPYGGDFTAPVRTTMVWPQKPPGAQMVKGEVTLQLIVTKNGDVQDIQVLSGLPQGVTEAAIEAVRQWKFRPARQKGEPVTVYHRVSLRF